MAVTYRFLFDECLTLVLPESVHTLGYEATSVHDLNRLGASDPALALYAVENDWVFVTNNGPDFVRLYRRFEAYSGLVIILPNDDPDEHVTLFQGFLARLAELGDLFNKVVRLGGDGSIAIEEWPPAHPNADL